MARIESGQVDSVPCVITVRPFLESLGLECILCPGFGILVPALGSSEREGIVQTTHVFTTCHANHASPICVYSRWSDYYVLLKFLKVWGLELAVNTFIIYQLKKKKKSWKWLS